VRGGSSTGPLLTTEKVCGINKTQNAITFNGPISVTFRSDGFGTARGFSAEVSGKYCYFI